MMKFEEFLQKCGKSELLSLVRGYEAHMKRAKKFKTLEDYYNTKFKTASPKEDNEENPKKEVKK